MRTRLAISRPRPTRGEDEWPTSFGQRLLAWYIEQQRRGWELSALPPLSDEDRACFEQTNDTMRRLYYQNLQPRMAGTHGVSLSQKENNL